MIGSKLRGWKKMLQADREKGKPGESRRRKAKGAKVAAFSRISQPVTERKCLKFWQKMRRS